MLTIIAGAAGRPCLQWCAKHVSAIRKRKKKEKKEKKKACMIAHAGLFRSSSGSIQVETGKFIPVSDP
ncbi:hypothetical protein I5R65_15505 [Herbaspirillum sp. AP02]|uniref:hypothetical protein n=1 Tax=unclassified Herbaspirillum TaxID=2624150 RepID=UPI0015D97FF3|nr:MULTISPECIES: hypothetical protein [unclassified Herbaspirillum]MBG7620873.1 hypothetical protein [Herbaspirillum sp. AP02]NZD68336.1 hypothetical protein [Herbaspirillum sp. AP21]